MSKISIKDEFGTTDTYKLFRTVYEIIHPTISKKNISNYKIIVKEDLIPLRIFYPKKISKIEKIVIYIHGSLEISNNLKNYTEVCQKIVENTEALLIALDYESKEYQELTKSCINTINFLIKELNKINISSNNITVMGDSLGASLLASAVSNAENYIKKQILLYPALNLTWKNIDKYPSLTQSKEIDIETLKKLDNYQKKYINEKEYTSPLDIENYDKWPTTLVITGDLDPLRDEGKLLGKKLKNVNKKSKEVNIKFATHGFLNGKDEESIEECMKEINKFILKDTNRSD